MSGTDGVERLDAVAGAAGAHATEAFSLLGNETRLAILLAIWEAYDPAASDNAVAFSRIFERVEYDDPGNLRYHLEKLEGQFIHRPATGDGYALRLPGLKLVRAVIAGAGVYDASRPATEIDERCPFCAAPTTVSYRDGTVVHDCTSCAGPMPDRAPTPGELSRIPFDPAGLADRSAEELRAASVVAALRQVQSLFDGLCPACSGPVDGHLECCTDHDTTGHCETCRRRVPAWARFECRTCKNHSVASPKHLALFHPAVVSFYDDHGLSTRIRADDFESVTRVYGLLDAHDIEVETTDPLEIAVEARRDGDAVRLLFDEFVSVIDVCR